MAPRETENNAYAKFWADKQRALWYVMVFSGVVNLSVAFQTTHPAQERLATSLTLFEQRCRFFYVPQEPDVLIRED